MAAVARDMRRAQLAKVHIARKELSLDETTYRDVLQRITGKNSAGQCSEAELDAVLTDFKRVGWTPKPRKSSRRSTPSRKARPADKYLPKLRALWLSGAALGCVRDSSNEAMTAFIKRQTGLDHSQFLSHAVDAARAIEALKSWLSRDAGVAWSDHPGNPRRAVVEAQWEILINLTEVEPINQLESKNDLWLYASKVVGRGGPQFYDTSHWDQLIRALGDEISNVRVGEN